MTPTKTTADCNEDGVDASGATHSGISLPDGWQINLVCCTQTLCELVADPKVTQKSLASTYAMTIKSAAQKADEPDWSAINGAILSRWKMSGLERIKKRAFDILSGKVQP